MTTAARALRVLVVTVVHDPEDARVRHRQLVSLLEGGCEVTYAAPFTAYGRTPPPGVEPVDLPRAVGRRRARAALAARRVLRERGPHHDVVLLHDPELLLAVLPRPRGTVVVWDVHEDTAAALSMKAWLPAPLRRLLPAVVRGAERLAERGVRLTLAETGYRERFGREHPVVPNSVLVPHEDLPAPGADRVVYLGRVTGARGGLDLVELGRLLAGEVEVEVVGPADGDVREHLQRAHDAGHVRWRGFVPNDEALAGLPGALAGLSLLHDEPNYAHSRPTKVMEYMAHGLPVVTTPTRAAVELVERAGCGVVVPFEDPAAAAAVVRDLRRDAVRRSALAQAGRAHALAELDWRLDGARFVDQLRRWADAR
ncbi:glycosyltransferase family 4 protein [uncultured Pseudokineococcus sp.]|uniref:glycosyltransferase family 4 protein n=1 Tax=uncultured Pseudokineococcus sp. TaxID=1642928 RepID=UPI0026094F7F|nr:glycosyltransferase family 4 protein [uncultured Pseudokineococcus sp.]